MKGYFQVLSVISTACLLFDPQNVSNFGSDKSLQFADNQFLEAFFGYFLG